MDFVLSQCMDILLNAVNNTLLVSLAVEREVKLHCRSGIPRTVLERDQQMKCLFCVDRKHVQKVVHTERACE